MRNEVSPERTHWRDEALSLEHKKWGLDCPAVDIDFLMMEYDQEQPCGLVEYKHQGKGTRYYQADSNLRALINLGKLADLPVFCVRYAEDLSWWDVMPLNAVAKRFLPGQERMTKEDWVNLLYHIRGRVVPDKILTYLRE